MYFCMKSSSVKKRRLIATSRPRYLPNQTSPKLPLPILFSRVSSEKGTFHFAITQQNTQQLLDKGKRRPRKGRSTTVDVLSNGAARCFVLIFSRRCEMKSNY